MSGTALSDFNDFVEATGPNYVTGPMDLVNEAVKNTYWFGRLLNGAKAKKKLLSGGANLRESIVFKDNGTFETYLPGETHNWKNPQRLEKIQAEWRYTIAHMAWTEQEILLNQRVENGGSNGAFQAYVDIRNEKEMLMWTAKWNGMEDLLWRQPNSTDMESQNGLYPYSIPAFINEETNGLFNSDAADTSITAFSTVEGVDPTSADVDGKWAPQTATYDDASPTGSVSVFNAFDEIFHDLQFEQPPSHKMYWEDPRYNKQMIVTTKNGRSMVMHLLRQLQDHFVYGGQDPSYPDPSFYGIPISRASTLEGAALYEQVGGGGLAAENAANILGPRFYWINSEYLYPVFHSKRYFHKHEVTKHHNVPDTYVCPVATWYNLICTSRQRQGLVSPRIDQTSFIS